MGGEVGRARLLHQVDGHLGQPRPRRGGAPGAPGRSWGEKWEEKWGAFNEDGRAGTRQGVTWDEMGGGHREKTWGEEHYPDGRKHKYGNSSDGSQYWDEWEDGDGGWWEVMPPRLA